MQHGKILLTVTMMFGLASLNAQATLTTTVGGLGIYDSGINSTWTKDANLLGTLEGAYGSNSYNNIVTAIINANGGVIHDTPNNIDLTGTYTLTTDDFADGGLVDWWAGQAFVNYLNTINYGGSSHWALPSSNAVYGYDNGSQLGELFYNELGGISGSYIPRGPFSNVQQTYAYWSGTEHASIPDISWFFYTYNGEQNYGYKNDQFYAWAVSPGNVASVPEPNIIWLFATGLLGFLGLKRRSNIGCGSFG
ncbi:DUF1566 domain-containing protein [Methylomonas paludis]|uniref:DUF1566 domain-containing protein n=1 Tax=Methylomonas paludis TaxID=1173101 RepID=A0A975MLK2_9GAMM|nr:DUF1566 domain-containing protein [Methylomonas paludis]QWF69624.1 DUF1566 domain-containing protein [Methylomonas paludis]